MKQKSRKRNVKSIGIILLAIAGLLPLGRIYEQLCRDADYKRYPPVGEMVEIDGCSMHLWADGTGTATVVFRAGYQIPSGYIDFYPLYSEIVKYTRVAVYDKPGYGWSETTEAARDIDHITEEIHSLLEQSGEKHLFVAHSIASLEAIRFAQRYGDEVRGIMLIDGANPGMYASMELLPSETFAYQRVRLSI